MVFCCVFFFNGLSTTRNYPYVHTLSLHCALPFSSLGAAPVYVLGTRKESTQNVMLAFAAGVMLAATFFSLLLPALDRAEAGLGSRGLAATGVIAALLTGALVMHLAHQLAPHEHFGPKGRENADLARLKRVWLFVIAIALHNFPEGLAVGIAAGRDRKSTRLNSSP